MTLEGQPSANQSVFDVQLGFLKHEVEELNRSIGRLDMLSNATKNWSILLWAGSLGLVFRADGAGLRQVLPFLSAIPMMFWIVDATWKRIQIRMSSRQMKISEFLNGDDLARSMEEGRLCGIRVLDILGAQHGFGRRRIRRTLRAMFVPAVVFFYCLQIAISVAVALLLS